MITFPALRVRLACHGVDSRWRIHERSGRDLRTPASPDEGCGPRGHAVSPGHSGSVFEIGLATFVRRSESILGFGRRVLCRLYTSDK